MESAGCGEQTGESEVDTGGCVENIAEIAELDGAEVIMNTEIILFRVSWCLL